MTSPAPQTTPRIRSVHRATGSEETAVVTTGADTAVGDVLVAITAADWLTVGDLPTPSGTAGTWRYIAVGDRGTNATHVKAHDRKVTVKGSQRVTVAGVNDLDVCLVVIVLDGATIDPTSWYDAWQGATGAATRNHVAPAVSPVGTADLLVTAHATSDSANAPTTVATYSQPTGMRSALRQGSSPTSADSIASDAWIALGVFTESRTAAGGTGTRTATSSVSRPWAGITVAFRGATQAVPVVVDMTAAPVHHRGRGDLDMVVTGTTYDLEPVSVHHRAPEPLSPWREVDVEPALVHHRAQATDVERFVDIVPSRRQHRPSLAFLTNLTVTPTRVRHGGQALEVEFRQVTRLTEQRRVVTTRPRRRLRYLAQTVLTREWRSGDVGIGEDRLITRVNGATEIGGKVAARELRDLGVDNADLWIHAELDGSIRGSGMLTPKDFAWGGPEIEITANGITSYPHRLRWEGDYTLRGETGIVGIAIDPLDVVRHVWAHAQSYGDGRVGAVLSTARSPVRIGEPEKQQSTSTAPPTGGNTSNTPATGAAPSPTDAAEQTTGPYILKWHEDTNLGKVIDDLAKSTPFDYRELPFWKDAAKTDVVQFVEFGYPRVGRDRTNDGIVFAEHENLTQAFAPVEHDDIFATTITVLGKGEGSARIRATYGKVVPGRVRVTAMVEKKDCSTTPMAAAFARAEWPRRQGYLSVDEVHLKVAHPNAPYGSFDAGDDVPCRFRVEGLGPQNLKHRVMELVLSKQASELVAKTQRSDTFSYGSSAAVT